MADIIFHLTDVGRLCILRASQPVSSVKTDNASRYSFFKSQADLCASFCGVDIIDQ